MSRKVYSKKQKINDILHELGRKGLEDGFEDYEKINLNPEDRIKINGELYTLKESSGLVILYNNQGERYQIVPDGADPMLEGVCEEITVQEIIILE